MTANERNAKEIEAIKSKLKYLKKKYGHTPYLHDLERRLSKLEKEQRNKQEAVHDCETRKIRTVARA